ncbi:MAG: glycine zipper family protein [Prevotellaceae bacterium]|jgi:hypothetical protein|nr:glycine zipper family protein [Prevotellaceae bacterium]
MKKSIFNLKSFTTFVAAFAVVFTMVFSSCEKNQEAVANHDDFKQWQAAVEYDLSQINAANARNVVDQQSVRLKKGWKIGKVCAVFGADVCSAVEGGRIGAKVGAFIGTLAGGNTLTGAAVGGAVLGLICGVGGSYAVSNEIVTYSSSDLDVTGFSSVDLGNIRIENVNYNPYDYSMGQRHNELLHELLTMNFPDNMSMYDRFIRSGLLTTEELDVLNLNKNLINATFAYFSSPDTFDSSDETKALEQLKIYARTTIDDDKKFVVMTNFIDGLFTASDVVTLTYAYENYIKSIETLDPSQKSDLLGRCAIAKYSSEFNKQLAIE